MTRRGTSLLGSTPFRLALALVALFALVSFTSLAATYKITQRSFEQAMRADLVQDMAGFRAAPSASALAQLVQAEARSTDPARLVLSYLTPTRRHVGNVRIARDANGYHIIAPSFGTPQISGEYLSLTATLQGGQLTIARSLAEVEALGRLFRNSLWLSLIPTILIALSGGLWLAQRSAAHVGRIERALEAMTGGKLSARVTPDANWPADLYAIGRKIDTMAEAQQTSVAAIRQVSSDIAHDLKSPIQRVAVHLDRLDREGNMTPQAQSLLAKAQEELTGITSIFHALLQLNRIESGSPKAGFAAVDLSALCATVCELYEPTATEGGRELHFTPPPSDTNWTVSGDKDLLGQLLANLLENALRHTPGGTTITLDLTRKDGRIQLGVSDTGPGIPVEEHTRVLRRLYRMDRSRNTPGNGLGLSLVSSIAALHGAKLDMRDTDPGLSVILSFDPASP